MCVLFHLLICTALRAHIIVVEALCKMLLLLLLCFLHLQANPCLWLGFPEDYLLNRTFPHLQIISLASNGVLQVKGGEGDPDPVAWVSREDPAAERVVGVVLWVVRGHQHPFSALHAPAAVTELWQTDTYNTITLSYSSETRMIARVLKQDLNA